MVACILSVMGVDRVWLGLYFPLLELEASTPDDSREQPVALVDVSGKCITHANSMAQAAGLQPGMPCSRACAMVPELLLLEPDWDRIARQQRHLERLAGQFAEHLFWVDRGLLLVDLTGTDRLWGKGVERQRWLHRQLADWPVMTLWALAPSPYACWLLARWSQACCESRERQHLELARLPVGALAEFDPQWPVRLRQIGSKHLAGFFRLSRRQLVALLGREAAVLRDRLLDSGWLQGKQQVDFPEAFVWQQSWDDEVNQFDALLFRLQRPLELLHQKARKKCCRVRQIELLFRGAGHASRITLAFSEHTHSVRQWLHLLRLRMASLAGHPVDDVVVSCRWFEPLLNTTNDLFSDGCHVSPNAFLDRVRARLGTASVFFLAPRDEHRPEIQTSRQTAACVAQCEPEGSPRPLGLLPEPQPTTMSCWHILGGRQQMFLDWWGDAPCWRDYVHAVHADGRKAWLFRDRLSGCWFVHGYWS
jgi:protein ImuB